jgi:hypothetical protein
MTSKKKNRSDKNRRPVPKGKKTGSILDLPRIFKYKGAPKTIEEMDAGIIAEVRRRKARGEY